VINRGARHEARGTGRYSRVVDDKLVQYYGPKGVPVKCSAVQGIEVQRSAYKLKDRQFATAKSNAVRGNIIR
jgi:hypothetical protein